MKRIVALATCFNRKLLTLKALASLVAQQLPEGYTLSICLVDDGSNDGTSEAIKAQYPNIHLLKGSGSLYWAGGMRFGWNQYVKHQEFDYLLVFNDDVELQNDAVAKLVEANQITSARYGSDCVVSVAAFQDPEDGSTAYGGVVRPSKWRPLDIQRLAPGVAPILCDTLNMNLALISKSALDKTGFLAPDFQHGWADFDFGLRLNKLGGKVALAPGYMGHCTRNPVAGTSKEPGISAKVRLKRALSIKEQAPKDRLMYCRRHGGLLWPIWFWVPYLRVIRDILFSGAFKSSSAKHR